MPEMKRAWQNIKLAKFEVSDIEEWILIAIWTFEKIKGFVLMESTAGEQDLAHYTNRCNFFKKFKLQKHSFFNARGLKRSHFATSLWFISSIFFAFI